MAQHAEINGWLVHTSPDGQYLYITRDGAPGQIDIKADDEGFVVDIWSTGEGDPESYGSVAVLYAELEPE